VIFSYHEIFSGEPWTGSYLSGLFFIYAKGAETMPENRLKTGQFSKGQSGNPGGRPKENLEAKEILKAATPDAARVLVELLSSKNEKIRIQSAQVILDRTQGKPRESVLMDVNGNLDVRAQVRSVLMERLLNAETGNENGDSNTD